MATSEQSVCSRITYQSITKELRNSQSEESGCKSADEGEEEEEENANYTSHSTPAIELSTRTEIGGSENDIHGISTMCNKNNASVDRTPRRSASTSSQLIHHSTRKRLQSFSPDVCHQKNDPNTSRAQSYDTLSLHTPLRGRITNDSGTGNSITQMPHQMPPYYEVPVYGLEKRAFMVNRFDFDLTKVAKYIHEDRKAPVAPLKSPKESTSIRGGSNSHKWKIPTTISAIFRNKKTSYQSDRISLQPLVRHHPSHQNSQEDH